MSLFKIKRIPLYFKRFSWEIDFHEITLLPFIMIFANSIFICMSLSDFGMQLISYATLASVLVSFFFMLLLFAKDKKMSQYGFLYVLFFIFLIGLTIVCSQDIKNCIYISMSIWLNLMLFSYYRNRTEMVICSFCIALTFCIYVNFLHLITHPSLWLIQTEKEGAGYLLGNNYNQMGCRMMIALASNVACIKISHLWRINFIVLTIVSITSLYFVGSMTSLSMIAIFAFFCIIPSIKLRKVGIFSLFLIYVLFQTFVVFSGKGLENNETAVYVVEDILHKDITFTHRTYMWESALKVINESPLCGWGFVSMDWYKTFMTSFAAGPHNFILSIFINGGIFLFSIFLTLVYKTYLAIKSYINEREGQCLIFASICLYFMGLMEMYPYPIMFYILILMYYYPYLKNERKHK